MREINIAHMKITQVEQQSQLVIGRSKQLHVIASTKNNMSFGNETSDGSIHIRSFGKIEDSDFMDSNHLHRIFPG
jgi:hypothetical protein